MSARLQENAIDTSILPLSALPSLIPSGSRYGLHTVTARPLSASTSLPRVQDTSPTIPTLSVPPSPVTMSSASEDTDTDLEINCAFCGCIIGEGSEMEFENDRLEDQKYELECKLKAAEEELEHALKDAEEKRQIAAKDTQDQLEHLMLDSIEENKAVIEQCEEELKGKLEHLIFLTDRHSKDRNEFRTLIKNLVTENSKLKKEAQESARKIVTLEKDKGNVKKQLEDVNAKFKASPLYKELKEEVATYKKAAEDAKVQKRVVEAAMPGKKKQQVVNENLKGKVQALEKSNSETRAAMKALEVQLSRMTRSRDEAMDEGFKLREALTSTESNLGSLVSTVQKFDRESSAQIEKHAITTASLEAANATLQTLTPQLAAARERLSLAKYPLECYAKIRQRLFRHGRADKHFVNEEGNRMAHDANLVADACMILLNNISPFDADYFKKYYPTGTLDAVRSYADVARLRSRGFAQELIDLRASMKLEDSSTRIPKLTADFQALDNRCMVKWAELGGDGVSDEVQCRWFNDDEEVDEIIQEMRIIRKKAAGWVGRRIAYGDGLLGTNEPDGIGGDVASLGWE
ncbi:hypothetical protein VTL71DRAFT_8815 [Oculimacula yallundae]|uniref:Uncharacterized protein n=1 Tax=Oculimacula yallundae TaxID=86028 RepID=A0ABR4CYS8_9HELO